MSDTDLGTRLRPWIDATMFDHDGQLLRLGVSGGADSLALLALARAQDIEVTAVHVDHGQRPGGSDESELVADRCAEVGAGFEAHRVTIEPGPNLEARMRSARYALLGPDAATGHTADDQAETVLINLMRGAGLRGLGAMRPGRRRPILALRRQDTVAVCDALGWTPLIDPSNADCRFTRNRVRHELLPLLSDIAGRDVVPILVRMADHARSGTDFIDDIAATIDPADAPSVAAAPDVVAAAVITRWVRTSTAAEHPIDAAAIQRVLAVASGERIAAEVPGGWRVSRSGQRLSIS